uniref:Uncharacterized protein n=1 Tax=Candidatus Kentrum sp. FW TaxID=2126338 RepID=A0A450T0J7_9GAMM|nr:MAG: hypothetical protein BECKFW1821A_GA0114235_100245 [Candidatus Kentron sp. FW]VFJ60029.1 MAG: hypothetical protein BECKFW1821B_GA0114236_105318 [Candidatus Kentron sp. FW]
MSKTTGGNADGVTAIPFHPGSIFFQPTGPDEFDPVISFANGDALNTVLP